MHLYLARRLLLMIPTLIGVSIVVFLLVRMLPGDAVTMLLQDYAYAKDADQMAEGEKFFSGKVSIGELVAEEDADHRGDGKHAAGKVLLPAFELQHRHVIKNLDLPGAPDGDLEHHHQEEFEPNGFVHAFVVVVKRC